LNSRIEEVLIVDSIRNNFLTPLMSRKKSPNTKLIINSIENLSNTEINKFKHFDCIVHLAAETDVSKTSGLLADFLSLNLTPTRKIIEIARLHGIPIIFPSSTSVYDRSGFELTESSFIQQPYTPYAQCKLLEEKELNAFFNSGGTGAILRLGTIHGFSAGMKFHTAVNKMVLQAASKKTITVWRTALNQLRPYLSLIDLNNAISLILESRKFTGDTYNLATSV
jgi:nucleoside-diphosphate-sugar epimerase